MLGPFTLHRRTEYRPRLSSVCRCVVAGLSAVLLAVSPALSWYAYADESNQVLEVSHGPRGDQGYRGAGSAVEPGEVGAQCEVVRVSSGEAQEEAFRQIEVVPSPAFDCFRSRGRVFAFEASYCLVDSLLRSFVDGWAYAVEEEESDETEFGGIGNGPSGSFAVGQFGLDESDDGAAPEGFGGDVEPAEGAEEDSSEDNGGITYYDDPSNPPDDSFGGFAGDGSFSDDGIMPLGLTEVGYLDKIYFALGANSGQGSETFKPYSVSWSAIKGTINWVASKIYVNVAAISEDLSRANNYLQVIDTSTKYHRSEFQSAWGYGYGGTAVFNSNSPAGWLQKIRDYNVSEYYDGYTYSTAKYLAFIFREVDRVDAKLSYEGSLVGGESASYSSTRLLARIHNALYGEVTYAETGNGGVRSAVGVLGYLANLTYYGNQDASRLVARNTYTGGLVGVSGSDTYGTARLLARIHNALYGTITYAETGVTAVRSPVEILGYISNLIHYGNNDIMMIAGRNLYQGGLNGVDGSDFYSTARLLARLYNANVQEVTLHETGGTAYRSTAGLLGYIANLGFDTLYTDGELLETGTSGKRSLADLMRYNANLTYLIKETVSSDGDLILNRLTSANNLLYGINQNLLDVVGNQDNFTLLFKGLQQSVTDWANHWWYDFYLLFVEWGKAWEARPNPSIEVDTAYIEAKLDTIADLMKAGAARDFVDALVGDFDLAKTAAAAAQVEPVMSRVFPFCVPAVVKQIFGLFEHDVSTTLATVEVWGIGIDLDLTEFQLVADVSSWVARILFTIGLLVNTRKFIYTGGGVAE